MTFTVTAYTGDKITVGTTITRQPYTASVDAGMRGNVGYTGSQGVVGYVGSQGEIGYTGSTGAGYTGSMGEQGVPGYTGSMGTIPPFVEANTLVVSQYTERASQIDYPVETVDIDCSVGQYIVLNYPVTDITPNLLNLTLDNQQSTTVKLVMAQNTSVAHTVNGFFINSVSQSVLWQNSQSPVGHTGNTDVVVYDIYKDYLGNLSVLGKTEIYGQV